VKKAVVVVLLLFCTVIPVSAVDYTVPEVPDQAQGLLPEDRDSFAEGLWYVIRTAFDFVQPDIAQCGRVAFSVLAVALLTGLLQSLDGPGKRMVGFGGCVTVGMLLLQPVGAQIANARETVTQLSEYGKLLLPVMTAALAAQGGAATSAALYGATIAFDAVLSGLIRILLMPMVYIYLLLGLMHATVGEALLQRLREVLKSLMTWSLKTILSVFTAYLGLTGVVSGTADQTALKAAKMAISGMVPVVGGILSDASEAVLVSAGVIKNGVGIAGMLAVVAIAIVPFLRLGVEYLLLKYTGVLCKLFGDGSVAGLVEDFSTGMGFLLGMTGAMSLMLIISLMCFLKGMV
jgi:stage III sporulation protein AE